MKKELNSKSKRKWIIGGLAAFTSISLLTTGFAIWVVGVNSTENKNDVNVTVDTAQNKSIVFTMTLTSSSIELKESNTSDGKMVRVESSDVRNDPLTISYSNMQIVYGDKAGFDYDCIKFSIAEPGEGETESYASVKSKDSKLTGEGYARATGTYTYLEAPDTIMLSNLDKTQNDSITTYSSASGSLTFKWGSFFDNKSPATYYNTKYANENDNAKLATASGEITTELNDMNTQLNGKKIKLVATLAKTAA